MAKRNRIRRVLTWVFGVFSLVVAALTTLELVRQSAGLEPTLFSASEKPIVTGKNWHIFYTPVGLFLVWVYFSAKYPQFTKDDT